MSTKQGGALQQSHSSRQKVLSSFSSTATADKVQAVAAEANYSAQFSFKNYYFQVKINKLELVNFFPHFCEAELMNALLLFLLACVMKETERKGSLSVITSPSSTTQCKGTECWIALYCGAEILIDICVHCTPFPCWQVNNTNSTTCWKNPAGCSFGFWSIRPQKALLHTVWRVAMIKQKT